MANKLPYLATPGIATNVLNKIKEARQPERFTTDFLSTKLGCKGGNAAAMVPMLKKMGFLNSDGSPTKLYSSYRNESTSGSAVAAGIRSAYQEIYDRNEYAHHLTKTDLTSLVMEITGLEKNSVIISRVVSTFEKLKDLADFESHPKEDETPEDAKNSDVVAKIIPDIGANGVAEAPRGIGMNLSYTINLNLPETANIEVFNAIFRSLKENLLRK